MKSFIISIILLVCLIVFSAIHSYSLDRITDNMISKNDIIIENIYDENYSAALLKLEELDKYIDSRRTILTATLDHSVLNKIDEYIAEAGGYISECERSDSLVACYSLSTFLENMPKNYRLKIDNIL